MRITGGAHRSRTLVAPRGQETRPTSDRVREALFSMLVSDAVFGREPGPRVLDLYAGSGALGLEALSRGATHVVFVESARPAVQAIRTNVEALGVASAVRLKAMPVLRALREMEEEAFDLVLLDPPYADVRGKDFAAVLDGAAACTAEDGVLVLEHDASDEPASDRLELDRRRRHGDTALSIFRIRPGRSSGNP